MIDTKTTLALLFLSLQFSWIKAETTTPLTKAIRLENYQNAKKYLTKELVNVKDQGGYHPLSYAIYTGNEGLVKALLRAGADPNQVEENKKTPLFIAANLVSPEMIKILHRRGAIYPKGEAYSPVRAAVQSGSVDTLDCLLELYPESKVSDGWPWPKTSWEGNTRDPNFFTHLNARSGLNHAIAAGMPEMIDFLIGKGVDLKATDSRGRTALHLAAWSSLCDEQVILQLRKRGLDPLKKSRHHHFGPSTALDYAAMNRSMAKVKAMASGLDGRSNKDAIRRSAFIASAFGNTETMEFLFRLLGEEPPSARSLMQQPRLASEAVKNDDHLFADTDPLGLDLPNLSIPRKAKGLKRGSVALIASKGTEDIAALLEAKLSGISGVTLVERTSLDPLVSEKMLRELSQGVTKEGRQKFLALDARQLLFLHQIDIASRRYLEVTLVSSLTGMVEARQVLPSDQNTSEEWINKNLGGILNQVAAGATAREGLTAVSLTPLVANSPGAGTLSLVKLANIILPTAISRSSNISLLERSQLAHLELESAIGGRSDYWKAGWIIEGGVELRGGSKVIVSLAATLVGGGQAVQSEAEGEASKVSDVTLEAWQALAKKMDPDIHPNRKDVSSQSGEADSLAEEARWFLDASYPRDAERLAEAAYILGNRSPGVLRTITEAILVTLPNRRSKYCIHANALPTCIPPEYRLRAIYDIDRYLKAAQSANLYLKLKKGPLDLKKPRQKYFNEVISLTLSELFFYRILVQDSLHSKKDKSKIAKLDAEIHTLVKNYLKAIQDHLLEAGTLSMIRCGYPQYLEDNLPDLCAVIDRRIEVLCAEKSKTPEKRAWEVDRLLIQLSSQAGILEGNGSPDRTSLESVDLLRKIASRSELGPYANQRVMPKLLPPNATRKEKLAQLSRQQKVINQSKELISVDGSLSTILNLLLGVDGPSLGSVHGALLQGFQHIVQNPDAGLLNSAEFRRNPYSYRVLSYLAKSDTRSIERSISRAVETLSGRTQPFRMKNADLIFFKSFLTDREKLTEKTIESLKFLADEPEEERKTEGPLPAKFRWELPDHGKLRGRSQHLRVHQVAFDEDHLWLPSTYFKPGRFFGFDSMSYANALHRLDLTSGQIESAYFPEAQGDGGAGPRQRAHRSNNPASVQRIFVGQDYVFFLSGWMKAKLYSVSKKSLAVKEIELPLPVVLDACAEVRNDVLYLSLVKKRNMQITEKNKAPNMVVRVSGDGSIEELVSTHRRPAKTPIDRPGVYVDALYRDGDDLVMISNREMNYAAPESFEGIRYDTSAKEWSEVQSKKKTAKLLSTYREYFLSDFFDSRRIEIDGEDQFLTDSYINQSPSQKLVVAKDIHTSAEFQAGWLTDRTKSSRYQLIDLEAEIPTNSNYLDNPLFPKKPDSGKLESSLTILKRGEYGISPIGIWRNQILLTVSHGNYQSLASPAIWSIPLNSVRQALDQ